MREVKVDRAAAEHHEGERRVGAVEAVGAAGDQSDLVQRFGVPWLILSRIAVKDPVAVLADRAAQLDDGSSRLRAALLMNRSISTAKSSTVSPGAKIARSASLSV